MPIPGPRNQFGALPGYRNPDMEQPDRFNHWDRPDPVIQPGRSPGTSIITLRGCVLAAGQIRRMWQQSVNLIPAQIPYSWTRNGEGGQQTAPPVGVTRALRYMTRSVYAGAGIDNTRYEGLHTAIPPRARRSIHSKGGRVTLAAGSVRSRPTVRNRVTSFGSRVPTLNQTVEGAAPQ